MIQSYRKLVLVGREFLVVESFGDAEVVDFILKIDFAVGEKTGCWVWTGGRSGNGYGHVYLDGKHPMGAHRAAWLMFRGSIPSRRHLHHRTEVPTCCIGPACVNPDHLSPLTPTEHVAAHHPFPKRGPRSKKTRIPWSEMTCPKGHDITAPDAIYFFPGTKRRRCRECFNYWQNKNAKSVAFTAAKDERTHCVHGHLFDTSNTYEYLGAKMCRACHADLTLRRYHEKRATAGPKTHCIHGHARAEHGVERKDGGWSCKACMAANGAKRWQEIRAERTVDGVVNCSSGHPMTPENLYHYQLRGKPMAVCKTCWVMNGRRAYEKRLAKFGKVPTRPFAPWKHATVVTPAASVAEEDFFDDFLHHAP